MQARLVIDATGYHLSREGDGGWTALAVLEGGAAGLLPAGGAIGQAALEMAIERSEDWLMPHAAALHGAALEVVDSTGRVAAGLQDIFASTARQWDKAQIESLFLELDHMSARPHLATRLQAHPEFAADLVLLRELAHHAALAQIRLR